MDFIQIEYWDGWYDSKEEPDYKDMNTMYLNRDSVISIHRVSIDMFRIELSNGSIYTTIDMASKILGEVV